MVKKKNLSIGEVFADDLDFYDYKKTAAKLDKWIKDKQLDQFPFLCPKHAPDNYLNIAYDYVNYDGTKVNNYLCNKCYPNND